MFGTSRPTPLIAQLLLAHLPLDRQQPPLHLGPLKGSFHTQYVNAFMEACSLHMSRRGLQAPGPVASAVSLLLPVELLADAVLASAGAAFGAAAGGGAEAALGFSGWVVFAAAGWGLGMPTAAMDTALHLRVPHINCKLCNAPCFLPAAGTRRWHVQQL
jgi:hypothetical protein